ncbi:MAG: purine-nucleoside phosphorylase [Verrucomicrobia bacterium]|nr:MAG: purine-nucleoside phosphorylase [Verrucomicrobiota bacterium]
MFDPPIGDALQQLRDWNAKIAIILGSGLNAIVQDPIESIDYAEFSEIPKPRVPGHAGKFSLCEIAGARVIFAQGRVHLYEGYSAGEVTASVGMLSNVGVKKLVVTNAAGALSEKFKPGDWMMINDHLNLTGTSPLIGWPEFLDLGNAYSARLQKQFCDAARKLGIVLHQGVYAAVVGPQYETAAEVRMLQNLGADAVGMSTVLEVIQARALEMEVAGFSCITNLATGLSSTTLSHGEVLETGHKAANDFSRLLGETLPNL